MAKRKGESVYHLMAMSVVVVWGITYISTKVLLNHGLTPAGIMFLRFLMAYAVICFIAPRKLWAENKRDEFIFLLLGLFGGSFYFQTENMALKETLASNVALILCTAPLWTAVLAHFFVKGERFRKNMIWGSLCALSGIFLVIFNGRFVLQISPKGDFLCLLAALSWAVYTLLLRGVFGRYSNLFITRKIFFYGLLTLLPVFFFYPPTLDISVLATPAVLANLLFLGLVASLLCYLVWNSVVKRLGVIRANNYIYGSPLVTLIASYFILGEQITWVAILGALLIVSGVYLAGRKM